MHEARAARLQAFVEWVRDHIDGDEKGEAQVFLDRLLQGFGHGGVREVGAVLEMRVRGRDRKGTAFADLVWKPYVLIEMKKRGEDLSRHYRQAFDYWTHLVPSRPRYVILCNFDEFWVYDFETQMDVPVDKVALPDLPQRFDPLAFLFPTHDSPRFGNHHEKVTRQAADRLAACFNLLMVRHVDRAEAQRFILQLLVALFAQNIGLLPRSVVLRLLDECEKPEDTYDLLGGLFEAMNTPGGVAGGRFKGVDYFNGGLFARPARLELRTEELNQLKTAADCDWSKVRPEIFGTIFEHTLESAEENGRNERRAFGCHFTHPTDIMKIVGPTIVRPWTELIENATTLRDLERLRDRMQRYTVLDPACGAGNFLYLAYRELKRLEARLAERMGEKKAGQKGQRQIGFVRANQFYGIDINSFAVEIAKVTMMIARKLAIDELKKEDERPLPLDNLDENFIAGDALIEPLRANGSLVHVTLFAEFETDPYTSGRVVPTRWPPADVIIGNPPFGGAKLLKPQRGAAYVNAVRKTYPAVPGMADYCVYWLRKTHDHLPVCTPEDPVAGRAGLVGTQNIRNNQSRVGGLDHIVQSGTIVEAVDNQPWSGQANVHVSIVNWVKHDAAAGPRTGRPADPSRARKEAVNGARSQPLPHGRGPDRELLIPEKRRLWYRVPPKAKTPLFDPQPRDPNGNEADGRPTRKDKAYDLAYRDCDGINSALSCGHDVSAAHVLRCNTEPQRVFNGQFPRHQGFVLAPEEARKLLAASKRNAKVVHPYLIGREMITHARPLRWVIDFQKMDLLAARSYAAPFSRIEKTVLPHIETYAERERETTGKDTGQDQTWLRTWWQHFRCRKELVDAIQRLPRYVACSGVTKRPIFCFVNRCIRPDHAIFAFAFADDYSFGILQSSAHWQWFITKCSKLTERFRYTPESVFDTFPWPQAPTKKKVNAVAKAGREIRRIRAGALPKINGGLRALYRTLELPGKNPLKDAHAALDEAVLDAYGFANTAGTVIRAATVRERSHPLPDGRGSDRPPLPHGRGFDCRPLPDGRGSDHPPLPDGRGSDSADLLAQLLVLNLEVAGRLDRGEAVTAPGVPPSYGDPAPLITDDCIQP